EIWTLNNQIDSPDKMCIRYLGFLLLIWFPGGLHAQSATQSCAAPRLDGGFFVPKQETYSDGTTLSFTCNNGTWTEGPTSSKWTVLKNWYEPLDTEDFLLLELLQINIMTMLNNLFFTSVSRCGTHPFLENGIVVDVNQMFLKNQCNGFYTQVGPDTVVCHNDGTWSKLPECKESFCVLDPAQYVGSNVIITTKEYLKEGEKKYFPCIWDRYFSIFQCTERRITMSRCKYINDLFTV
uniref:Sushi domain-containing protein n=1 Tax=Dicentrarchus labrax TaxID=13489 RepID=A0A8C4NRY6_DICLA